MTWIAPEVERAIGPLDALTGDERTLADTWLDLHRRTLLWKCGGLTAEQLKTRAVEPSNLSLLGLLRHMAEVERDWFRTRFAGERVGYLYCTDEQPDGDFDNVDDADAEADFATFASEVESARSVIAGRALDDTFVHPREHIEIDVRWLYVHMIEEYARHNGHADLLRERIDGVTGD